MPIPPMREGVHAKYSFMNSSFESNGFEYLRAPIALDGGDAHLGHDLYDALVGGLDEVLLRGLVIHMLVRK